MKPKTERILLALSNYKVVDGKVYRRKFQYKNGAMRMEWVLKVPFTSGRGYKGATSGYKKYCLYNGRGFGKVMVYEHELVWLFYHGSLDGKVGWKNGDRGDNRVENLFVKGGGI